MPKPVLGPRVPSPFPSSTDTVLELGSGATTSSFPSALRSATATDMG